MPQRGQVCVEPLLPVGRASADLAARVCARSGELIVMKEYNILPSSSPMAAKRLELLNHEINMLRKSKHANIVRYLGTGSMGSCFLVESFINICACCVAASPQSNAQTSHAFSWSLCRVALCKSEWFQG